MRKKEPKIRVQRALNVEQLEDLLNKVRPDDNNPNVIVDTPSTGNKDPEYTVIWMRWDVVE